MKKAHKLSEHNGDVAARSQSFITIKWQQRRIWSTRCIIIVLRYCLCGMREESHQSKLA